MCTVLGKAAQVQSCQNCPADQVVVIKRRQLGPKELLSEHCSFLSITEGQRHFNFLLIYNYIVNTMKQHSLYICTGEFLEGGRECYSKLLILHLENFRVERKNRKGHQG